MLLIVTALILLAGPPLLALAGWRAFPSNTAHPMSSRWHWTTVGVSALLYTLAFNLTFFVQELFLVVPKALTPGLQPTLYHNNICGTAAIRWRACSREPARWRRQSWALRAWSRCARDVHARAHGGCSSSGWRTADC